MVTWSELEAFPPDFEREVYELPKRNRKEKKNSERSEAGC